MNRVLLAALLCCPALANDYPAPERHVQANVLTSERDPKIRIQLPSSVRYVGADRWTLYDIADCELHIFVDATPQKKVERMYWVQFESYLPSRPELHHKYPFTKTDTLSGLLFDVRARFGPIDEKSKPGSDSAHVQALLRAKGYTMPQAMMNVRLVHLLDQQKRKELMIIYAEDLQPTGFSVNDLMPGGNHTGEWPALEAGLVRRAKAAITLSPQ